MEQSDILLDGKRMTEITGIADITRPLRMTFAERDLRICTRISELTPVKFDFGDVWILGYYDWLIGVI